MNKEKKTKRHQSKAIRIQTGENKGTECMPLPRTRTWIKHPNTGDGGEPGRGIKHPNTGDGDGNAVNTASCPSACKLQGWAVLPLLFTDTAPSQRYQATAAWLHGGEGE